MTEEAFLSSGGGKYRQLVHRGYGYSILLTSMPYCPIMRREGKHRQLARAPPLLSIETENF